MMTLDEFKTHFSSAAIHFNNAGQGPIPDVYRDCAIGWLERFYREGAGCIPEALSAMQMTREKLAEFFGATPEEVAFLQTTASALSQAAAGIRLSPGDEILTWDQEYPSNFYPWRRAAERSGAKLIQLESENWQTPTEKLLDCVNPKTRVIAVSWVQYQTGSVTDLRKISEALRGRGIWLVADMIQGAGVRPIHFHETGFDILCSGSHKWLCSAYGAAFMLIRKERMAEIEPLEFGAMTYGVPETANSFTLQPKASAARYESGSRSMVEIISLGENLDLWKAAGIENIFNEACRLADRLRQGLKARGFNLSCTTGPIVNFTPPDLAAISERLTAAGVTFVARGPGLRLSLHAFNRDHEVDRVLSLLD